MAKTLLDIDAALLDQARRLANVRSKRETVELALRELVRRHHANRLTAAAGRSSLRWTRADIRAMREGR